MPIVLMTSDLPVNPQACSIQEHREWTAGVQQYQSPLNKEQWWYSVQGASAKGYAVAYGGPIAAGATNADPGIFYETVTLQRTAPPPNCEWEDCSVSAHGSADGTVSIVLSHGLASATGKIHCVCLGQESNAALTVKGQQAADESETTTKANGKIEGKKDDTTGSAEINVEKKKKGVVGVADSEPTTPSIDAPKTDSCVSGTGRIRYNAKTSVSMGAYCGAWWVFDRAEVKLEVTNTITVDPPTTKCKCPSSVGSVPPASDSGTGEHAALVRNQHEHAQATLASLTGAIDALTASVSALEPSPLELAYHQSLEAIEVAPTPELLETARQTAERLASQLPDNQVAALARASRDALNELAAHKGVIQKLATMSALNYRHDPEAIKILTDDAQDAVRRAASLTAG